MTLDQANLVWLRGRATATGRRSVSDLLDALVTEARLSGRAPVAPGRSVVGTIDIAADDPLLERADEAIAQFVARSLSRPFPVRETGPQHAQRTRAASRNKRRG